MKIEKILAGIGFEKDTERVLAYASFFSGAFNASLNLLHVIDYLITPPAYLLPYIEEEKRAAEKKFEMLKKQMAEDGIRVETEVIVGRLQESFDVTTKKIKSDMLVLGFESHMFRRSSSEKLIKGLQILMLVVRGDKAESVRIGSLKIGRILCPTDFSEISGKALNVAKEMADKFSAQLEVIYVFPEKIAEKMKTWDDKDRALKELREKAKDRFEKFLGDSGIEETGVIDEGEPYRRIVSFAKEKDIDLIIMGARGLGLIQGMLIGSVTDAVLKSSPCPVLVIH
jgi:nucleotide-binding universal stress UspA family protein